MADSEKVQDQQQQLKQKIQNHSDGVNGESTPDSVIQPKQTIGEYKQIRGNVARCKSCSNILSHTKFTICIKRHHHRTVHLCHITNQLKSL